MSDILTKWTDFKQQEKRITDLTAERDYYKTRCLSTYCAYCGEYFPADEDEQMLKVDEDTSAPNQGGEMNDDDRKFLTEAMGECWHEWGPPALTPGLDRCIKCDGLRYKARWDEPCTFTTWADFGAVWEWAQKQEWWNEFTDGYYHCCRTDLDMVDPLRFPQLVVDFLKEAKP